MTPFIDLSVHHRPEGISDRIAYGFTKMLRWTADTFFAERYGHRAVVLETVAAVPGMVGATITTSCLRGCATTRLDQNAQDEPRTNECPS